VLLDESPRFLFVICRQVPFSPDTIRWRRAAIVELRKLGISL
jgi:hypothetical protein